MRDLVAEDLTQRRQRGRARPGRPGPDSRERLKALAQCRNASSTSTTMASFGGLPPTVIEASSSASSVTRPRPLTPQRLLDAGDDEQHARPGRSRRRCAASRPSRLPGRSGSASVRSSRMRTKPGRVAARAHVAVAVRRRRVPRQRNGESSMKRRQCASRAGSRWRRRSPAARRWWPRSRRCRGRSRERIVSAGGRGRAPSRRPRRSPRSRRRRPVTETRRCCAARPARLRGVPCAGPRAGRPAVLREPVGADREHGRPRTGT